MSYKTCRSEFPSAAATDAVLPTAAGQIQDCAPTRTVTTASAAGIDVDRALANSGITYAMEVQETVKFVLHQMKEIRLQMKEIRLRLTRLLATTSAYLETRRTVPPPYYEDITDDDDDDDDSDDEVDGSADSVS